MLRARLCDVIPLNSLLQRVARENVVRVAVEYLPVVGWWKERLGWGKRPAPIETDAVMRAGAAQDKNIVHTDLMKSACQDCLGAGVVIHEFMYATITVGGNALDQVIDADLGGSIRLRMSIDNHMALTRAGDGDSCREPGALVSGDGEAHGFRDHLMAGGGSRGG